MKYTSINIQGNLISEEILQKIEEADVLGQLAKDFGFEPGINLRSEIEYAWSRIKLDWKHFSERIEKLPPSDPYGTTLARKWMMGFFNTLGFEISLQKTSLQGDNDRQYTISHTCNQLDGLPVHIAGFYDPNHPQKNTLDIRSSGGTTRMSPHATIQEYLNVTEHLYAMVTNGMLLRLVRDSGHLVKLTYIEFDLKRLLDEDKYSEFTLLYRLLHSSRFPKSKQETENSLLEKYYQDSIESGNRIRDGLSGAVKHSLIALGNGLLEHPENKELREKVISGRPDARDFYHQLLRLIYRLLFLMVTEERDLIFSEIQDDNQDPDLDDLLNGIKHPTRKHKEIYYQYYSLIRLRKLSEKRYLQENQYTDLWQGLLKTFALFESGGTGEKMGILALGSELFSGNAMPDITSSKLNNKVLLQCIRSLNEFEDAKHNLSFINYRALDVEELGSVYEGLLELEPVFEIENRKPKFSFKKGSERSSSGSHYTPEDLVKPLIQHSLEYLIEERTSDFYKEKTTVAETKKKLLDLKVCDVACGSGHILLSAARRIAIEVARVETGEQQPNPTSFRHALKEVIRNCIYGVDKNPLAVELCKVALWLESHNPGEPLSFLDHRIKCGDAIVGLSHREELQNGIANEAYKKLPGDDKDIISAFLKKNKQERILREKGRDGVQLTTATDQKLLHQISEINQAIHEFSSIPENTPEDIKKKERAYSKLTNSENLRRLKRLADIQVLPFFLKKTEVNKAYLITDAQYHRCLRGEVRIPPELETKASAEFATIKKFFHWFLEFPEVFQYGGFDAIVGNPPYLGGTKISSYNGDSYFNYLKYKYYPAAGRCDLVGYFNQRIFSLQSQNGYQAIISTNTISEGDTREGGFDIVIKNNGSIIFANKSVIWPGTANVIVTIYSLYKGKWEKDRFLNNERVPFINAFLTTDELLSKPYRLERNRDSAFMGSSITGEGFIISNSVCQMIMQKNQLSENAIYHYINGADFNNIPNQLSDKRIINFFNEELEAVKTKFPELLKIVEDTVKPEREKKSKEVADAPWWKYWRIREKLYNAISGNERVLVLPRTSNTHGLAFIKNSRLVFSDAVVVFVEESYNNYSILQSVIHDYWAWRMSSRLKNDRRYSVTDAFETFPFPFKLSKERKAILENAGKELHDYRRKFMIKYEIGLTKTYSYYNDSEIVAENQFIKPYEYKGKNSNIKSICKLAIDYAHNIQDIFDGIIKLRLLHKRIDNEVLKAYGWQDINLDHDFYLVDYLPDEHDKRFTISAEARKELLKRLLYLNHEHFEKEIKQGLHKKKDVEAFYEQKDKPVPAGIEFSDRKMKTSKKRGYKVEEPGEGYGGLFN